jgi:glycerate kinase
MALKVLIVPDKFKGTLTAAEAAHAIARGWHAARLDDALELLPMSDGGDGFGAVMSELLGAKPRMVKTVDAAGRPCRARWWWEARSATAIIESANVIGLAQLPAKKFHPFELDTFGLGAVIRAAAKRGAKHCLIGIGGSATNDGGFGVARALGWKFLNADENEIVCWTQLDQLKKVIPPKRSRWFNELIVAVDVQNLLLGARGCSRIYGPQKGLRPRDFAHAEKCLRQLALVAAREKKHLWKGGEPGDGAAGGLGFGLRNFLGAKLAPGFELFAKHAELSRKLRMADLVITGEGSIDRSSMMGKGVGELVLRCARAKVPCVGLAGMASQTKGFAVVRGLTELTSPTQAKAKPAHWLSRLSKEVASAWK